MEIKIKPYSQEYANQCADLLQYLWKENAKQREKHFEWAYTNNPNTENQPLSVIAINENNEVIGFRGYHILSYNFGKIKTQIAYIADTVVSPNARRLGIFQNMTKFSFDFLLENGINCISDLGPSWPPYYGYKKLGFEDVCEFRSRYYFNAFNGLKHRLFSRKTSNDSFNEGFAHSKSMYYISNELPKNIIQQIPSNFSSDKIESIKDYANIEWKSKHPNAKYVYVWSIDTNNKTLSSFLWFKTYDEKSFHLAYYFSTDRKQFKKCFKLFTKHCSPVAVAAWSFAITSEEKELLESICMFEIPFINVVRKNPPVIVKSLLKNDDGSVNWVINGFDVRDVNNWVINKIDGDSF